MSVEELLAALAPIKTLQEVLRWGFSRSPPLEVVDVVVQDEYTHDLIARFGENIYLCFDTT
jgi:hypothetical protein